MKIKSSMVLALVIVLILPAATIYAWQMQMKDINEEEAIDNAVTFLRNCPTFKYDGITESINVTGAYRARTPIPTWLVIVEFDCGQSGYGDRIGQVLDQVITHHEINILVQESEMVSAIIDGKWDELNQKLVESAHNNITKLALDFLTNSPTYLFDGLEETIIVEETIIQESHPAKYIVIISFDSSHAGYGNRSGTDIAQVITKHTARISIIKREIVTAVLDGVWDVVNQCTVKRNNLPNTAKDYAIEYILENHLELGNISVPVHWVVMYQRHVTKIDGDNPTGMTCIQYNGDGWTVNVSYPATLKPTYHIEIEYIGKMCFNWIGYVNQDENITEISFTK